MDNDTLRTLANDVHRDTLAAILNFHFQVKDLTNAQKAALAAMGEDTRDVYSISYESTHEKRLLEEGEYWELEVTGPEAFCINITPLPRLPPPGLLQQLEKAPFWTLNKVNGKQSPIAQQLLDSAIVTVQGRFQKIHKLMSDKTEEHCKQQGIQYDATAVSRFLLADADGNVDDACKIAPNQLKYFFFTRSDASMKYQPLSSLLPTSGSASSGTAAYAIGDLTVAPADDVTRMVMTTVTPSGLCKQLELLTGDCITKMDGPNYAHPEAPVYAMVAATTTPQGGDALARVEQTLSLAGLPDTPGKQHPLRVALDVLQLEAWYKLASARAPCVITKAGPATAAAMDIDDEEEGDA
ncbi:hypothetical protein CHLRE_29g757897v5 [Chlamydomonas reinhardtii]|uniref:Uncharacterized protein n=1 Tax=Chlamydomonas reinhardtii TaxID=3055 RepID=A0A2K3CMY9_CHLRE|nr:uncharacterized protein CHLRE_29g757897v5 [Chlamydomonas reinhardtii]PNW69649.1 hypothetical protein CHLRE_29g757897v5 [Chlamydomonas reinhardtii]